MSGECGKCGEHTLECTCEKHWSQTEKGKKAMLKALNEKFYFNKDGTITAKNERSYEPIDLFEYLDDEN
jgi:hypothetical protein